MNFSAGFAVLTAMIAPAVLISACGTLILSTSQRLDRVITRTREMAALYEELTGAGTTRTADLIQRIDLATSQIDLRSRRVTLLQRALWSFFGAVALFVVSSVGIGIDAATEQTFGWFYVATALLGGLSLLVGALQLLIEMRLAVRTLDEEMEFIRERGGVKPVGRRRLPWRKVDPAP